MNSRQLSVIGALAAILLLAALGVNFWLAEPRHAAAPQAHFKTLSGEAFDTSDLRGKVVLVNFWATTCVTCVEEMPRMIETEKRYQAQGLETVAVAMDYDPPNRVLDYATAHQLPFKVALDIDGAVARAFGNVRLTPTSFLIDRQGRVIRRYLGEPDFRELRTLVEKELKKTV